MLTNEQGQIIGSALIAQGFTRPEYFWPRPSAVDYDAAATGGSNLSPANPKLTERAEGIIERYGLQGRPANPGRPGHGVGFGRGPAHHAGGRPVPGAARGRRARPVAKRESRR